MAKKGNMNIDKEDFQFDSDEMFPLDDSVYDDLGGFKFDPNGTGGEVTGVKGFFKNTIKSIKGFGVDFVNEFMPTAVELGEDTKSALSDTKDAFVEKKDKALNAITNKLSNKSGDAKSLKDAIKKGFKDTASNIKQGKFYISDRDKPVDMDSMFSDDDEYDDGESGEEEEQDVSGVMTTTFDYKKPRKKRQSAIAAVAASGRATIGAMEDIQESATYATATINTKLTNRQIANSNRNFYEMSKMLSNMSENIAGIGDFLVHYGKTNLKAQLEYDSKSLAFLTDQRAMLKDIIRGINTSIGISSKEDGQTDPDEERDKNSFMKFGSFDMSKYFKHVAENAKNLFSSSSLGGAVEMMSGVGGMGGMLKPQDLVKNMAKSVVFNKMLPTELKTKLDKLNDIYGNIGGLAISKINGLKDSDNSVLSMLGNLLGTDKGVELSTNLKKDLTAITPFTVKTDQTINEVIPGYLSKILSALTGEEETYYDHNVLRFRTNKSMKERYEQTKETAIASSVGFSNAIASLTDNASKNKNKYGLKEKDINDAMKIFRDNILETRQAIDFGKLSDINNTEYRDLLFRGLDSVGNGKQTRELQDSIIAALAGLDKTQLFEMNNDIFKTASSLEDAARNFKKNNANFGGLTLLNELNDQERYKALDYELNFSSMYNENKVKDKFGKQRARMNKMQAQQQMFDERGGIINAFGDNFGGTATISMGRGGSGLGSGIPNKINDIYNLLLDGLIVYPINNESAVASRLTAVNKISKSRDDSNKKSEAERTKMIKDMEEMKRLSREQTVEYNKEKLARKRAIALKGSGEKGDFFDNLSKYTGLDNLGNGILGAFSKPIEMLMGKDVLDTYLENSSFNQETYARAQEIVADRKGTIKDLKENMKQLTKNKKRSKTKGFGKVGEEFSYIKDAIANKLSSENAKMEAAVAQKEAKKIKEKLDKQKKIEKEGSYLQKVLGNDYKTAINIGVSMKGNRRGTLYVDPEFLNSLSENSIIRTAIFNMARDNNLMISDTLDEDVDMAIAKSYNKEDSEMMKKIGIVSFGSSKDAISKLTKYVKSSGFINEQEKRRHNRENYSNENTTEYSQRNAEVTARNVKKFDFKAQGVSAMVTTASNDTKAAYKALENYKKRNKITADTPDDKKKKIEEKTAKLLAEYNKAQQNEALAKKTAGTNKYPALSKIRTPKDAGKMFLQKNTQAEIDELLRSGDEEAILDFANSIKSKNDAFGIISGKDAMGMLDEDFRDRLSALINDPTIKGHGVSIRDSVRSPLKQFALYSKGRVDPAITDKLLKAAGVREGISMWPESIRDKMGPDGIVANTLSSNHMTGRAVDINNGNIGYDKIGRLAAKYGLSWNSKDKPHLEFNAHAKFNKDGSLSKRQGKTEASTVSGSLIEMYQSDPATEGVASAEVSGEKPKSGSSIKNLVDPAIKNIPKDKWAHLNYIENALYRIGNNTESIGFGLGIPGIKGKGLIGKIGGTAKDLVGKAVGIAGEGVKLLASGASAVVSGGLKMAGGILDKAKDFAGNIIGKGKDKVKGLFNKTRIGLDSIKKTSKRKLINAMIKFLIKNGYTVEDIGTMSNKEIFKKSMELGFKIPKIYFTKETLEELEEAENTGETDEDGNHKGKGLLGLLTGLAGGAVGKVKDITGGLLSKGKDILPGLFGQAKDFAGNIIGKGKDLAVKGKDALVNFTSGLFGKGGEGLLGNIGSGIHSAATGVSGFVSNLFGREDGNDFQTQVLMDLGSIRYAVNKLAGFDPDHKIEIKKEEHEEGTYADQKNDKETEKKNKLSEKFDRFMDNMSAVFGTPKDAQTAINNENSKPNPTVAGVLAATYLNSEKQNDALEEIGKNGESGGKLGGLGGKLGTLGKVAYGAAGVAAAGWAAHAVYKQSKNKVESVKANWKEGTFGERISEIMGGGGSSNYSTTGEKLSGDQKKGGGFGLGQVGHMATFAKIFGKIFGNPKIIAKVGGKAAAEGIKKGLLNHIKGLGVKALVKVSAKLGTLAAKATNPIGWGVLIAQLIYDIGTGMSEANRYFKMGKGMKPTWPMRIASGLAKAVSGTLTFGLIPPETIANLVFKAVGDKATKDQMKDAQEFDRKRAALLEVEYDRLVEFESMTWTEKLFGGDKKRATILGFMKGKKDEDGKEKFKTWYDKMYAPLEDMYKDMIKQYGGKVDKKIDPKDTEGMERVKEFREAYLNAMKNYITSNKLTGLGPLGKGTEEEKKESKNKVAATKEETKAEVAAIATTPEIAKTAAEVSPSVASVAPAPVDNTATPSNTPSKIDVSNAGEKYQADGINYAKYTDNNYVNQWTQFATKNAVDTKKMELGITARAGMGKKSLGSRIIGGAKAAWNKIKEVASNLVGGAKAVVSNAFEKIKGAPAAIAEFVTNRRATESQISSLFGSKEGQKEVIRLQKNIIDKSRLGQQTSSATLSPAFAERVEAFLKDPRIAGKGVKIREGYRSPATQLAYYSKGRAPSDVTNELMKIAGFKSGVNFWPSTFQKPGDYITWTLASNHFNGTAVDLEPGTVGYDQLGKIAAEYGIDWGGNWSTPDKPHFEMGDPNFKIASASVANTNNSETQEYQADAFNYDRLMDGYAKVNATSGSSVSSNLNRFNSLASSYISNNAKELLTNSHKSNITNYNAQAVSSQTMIKEFDRLYEIANEGLSIMEKIHEEQNRHNKVSEDYLSNIVKGIAALGAIIASSSNGGYTSIGDNGITNGIFDKIAKGI